MQSKGECRSAAARLYIKVFLRVFLVKRDACLDPSIHSRNVRPFPNARSPSGGKNALRGGKVQTSSNQLFAKGNLVPAPRRKNSFRSCLG
jgi:hypothetical protein